ncbi:MAG: NAD(P)H-dependent oxidoreductase [Bacteroidia bacterium]|nr:NAD(P)H-dependent oxidoreductase [Bacteroidia bacterium]
MITILSGSPRKGSNTLKTSKALKRIVAGQGYSGEVKIIDFHEFDIPSLAQGSIKIETLSSFQQNIKDSMTLSDVVFILTPEYNWFPSSEIISFINAFARNDLKELWDNKVFAMCGISNGRGGRVPAIQLSYVINKVLNVMNLDSIVAPKIADSQFTNIMLNEEGDSLGNAEYDKGLEDFVSSVLRISKRWKS